MRISHSSYDVIQKMKRVCVECGNESSDQQLYREFSGGTIQLTQCVNCNGIVDKYVEFDAVILLLDVLMLRVQSYRHLIYIKLRMLHLDSSSDSVILQTHFHTLLLQAILEFIGVLHLSYSLIKFLSPLNKHCLSDVYRTMVLTSCGRLSGLAALVWTGDFYLWIPWLLVIPAQLQSFRALLNTSLWKSTTIVLILTVCLLVGSQILAGIRDTLLTQFQLI